MELARERGLDEKAIQAIEKLHLERDKIHQTIKTEGSNGNLAGLKQIAAGLPEIELQLQRLWGFEENLNYYKFWLVPYCHCPRIDNEDNYPYGYYVINCGCPIHGNSQI